MKVCAHCHRYEIFGTISVQELQALKYTKQNYPKSCLSCPDYLVLPSIYTSVFVVTTDGVIVLDPMDTTHATQMLAAIREVTNQPVSYVAYSHSHWDHTGGAAVFNPRDVVTHEDAAAWIRENPKPDGSVVRPTIIWSGNQKTVQVGNQTVTM